MAILLTLLLTLLCYNIFLVIYRILFHPLRNVPGPRIAAITQLYEFYHNYFKNGNFMWIVERWHEEYGPIIRISPDEVHINDPTYLDEIYTSILRKRDKYPHATTRVGWAAESISNTIHQELHRLRRAAMNPFFSRRAVSEREEVVKDKVQKLLQRLRSIEGTGRAIRLDDAFHALTTDIVSHYAYGSSYDYLDNDDFNAKWAGVTLSWIENGVLVRQFPWVIQFLQTCFSIKLLAPLFPTLHLGTHWQENLRMQAKEIAADPMLLSGRRNCKTLESQKTVFHELLRSDLTAAQKEPLRIAAEGTVLLAAAVNATPHTLTVITFYLLHDFHVMSTLKEELNTYFPGQGCDFTWTELERLPYLNAVVTEGLRLGGGLTRRIPRVAPNEDLTYGRYKIPAGTPVSQTPYYILMNSDLFPDPKGFHPERWLINEADAARLKKYMIAFGKGGRICLGMNLALAQIYLTIASLVRTVDLKLGDCDRSDIEIVRDIQLSGVRKNTRGLVVTVAGKEPPTSKLCSETLDHRLTVWGSTWDI